MSAAPALAAIDPDATDAVERLRAALDAPRRAPPADALAALVPFAAASAWEPRPLHRAPDRTRYAALAEVATRAMAAIAAACPATIWIPVDARARSARFAPGSFRARDRWLRITEDAVEEAPLQTLGALSMHPDGHVREHAIAWLAPHGPAALPWLLLRAVDWVGPVRARAVAAVDDILARGVAPELLDVLPLALRLRGFSRASADPLVSRVLGAVGDLPHEALVLGLGHRDGAVRRAVYECLDELGRLEGEVLDRALRGGDPVVRSRASRAVGSGAGDAERRAWLRRDSMAALRLRGLELELESADREGGIRLAREALLDPARDVRARARQALRDASASLDVPALYRGALDDGEIAAGAIRGLAEVGRAADWERLVPALDRGPAIAAEAIVAMRRLDREATRELRLMLVDDPRPRVVRAAARSLTGEIWGDDERWLRAYLRSPAPHVRKHASRLAAQLPGWRAPIVLLELEHAGPEISSALASWLPRRWRAGAPPTLEEARAIRERLCKAPIEPAVRRSIAALLDFVAPAQP